MTSEKNTPPTGRERRVDERIPVRISVHWSDGQRARKGEILDASNNGMFLLPGWTPSDPIKHGDKLELRCHVDGQDIDLKGEVCWVGENSENREREGLGLRITTTDGLRKLIAGIRR